MSLMICTPQKTSRQSAPGELARRLGLHKNCLGREVSFWKQVACLVDVTQGFTLKQKASMLLNKKHHGDLIF